MSKVVFCLDTQKLVGTTDKPYLLSITPGIRAGESLIFHVQIGGRFHQLHLRKVNATSCNFACVERTCPAHHKMSVRADFVKCSKHSYNMKNGKTRHKYEIDRENPEIKNVSNWTVLDHPTLPHGYQRPGKPEVHICLSEIPARVSHATEIIVLT